MTSSVLAPAQVSIDVPLTPEQAFDLFATDFGRWWPVSHHIGADPLVDAVVEPLTRSRWLERDAGGGERDWGRVLAWDPPRRLVLFCAFGYRFTAEPDPAYASSVAVRFSGTREGTRVQMCHSEFERHGHGGDQMRAGVSRALCLAGYRGADRGHAPAP